MVFWKDKSSMERAIDYFLTMGQPSNPNKRLSLQLFEWFCETIGGCKGLWYPNWASQPQARAAHAMAFFLISFYIQPLFQLHFFVKSQRVAIQPLSP